MTFRIKDHRLPRKPQSPAQEAATQRSFRIFRLRGLHAQCALLTGDRKDAARAAVDAELAALGAETETARQAAYRRRWVAEGGPDLTQEIPF